MKLNNIVSSVTFLAVLVLISMRLSLGLAGNGGFIGSKKTKTPALGGVHNCKGMQNSVEIVSLARFAVQEHNKKENALLEFGRVLKAKEQVVAGKIYYLTLEVIDAGKKMVYEAKVWVKPWMKFKELQEFKYSPNGLLISSPGHGGKQGNTMSHP